MMDMPMKAGHPVATRMRGLQWRQVWNGMEIREIRSLCRSRA